MPGRLRRPGRIPALEKMLAQLKPEDAGLASELTGAIDTLQNAKPAQVDPHHPFNIFELLSRRSLAGVRCAGESDLLAMLESTSPKRRAEVAEGFFQAELSDKAKAKLFEVAQHDPDANVRGRAFEALGEHGEEPSIRKVLLAVVADRTRPLAERTGALVALSSQTDNPKVFAAIEDLYQEAGGRAKGLEAMWRSFNPDFAKYPPRHLEDSDLEVRRHAVRESASWAFRRKPPGRNRSLTARFCGPMRSLTTHFPYPRKLLERACAVCWRRSKKPQAA